MNPDNAFKYEADPVTCFACAARDRERREFETARRDGQVAEAAADGLFIVPVLREDGR